MNSVEATARCVSRSRSPRMRLAAVLLAMCVPAALGACRWRPAPVNVSYLTGAPEGASEGIATTPAGDFILNGVSRMWRVASPAHRNGSFEHVMAANDAFLSAHVRAAGYKHTGDTDVHDGVLYAPVSAWPNASVPGGLLSFNASTLEPVAALGGNASLCVLTQQTFAPWVAADDEYLYSSDYNLATAVHVYRRADCSYVRSIALSMEIVGAQGGVFATLNGTTSLMIAADDECIYSVDLATGATATAVCLWSWPIKVWEMEGLAFADLAATGMGQLHVLVGDFHRKHGTPRPVHHLEAVC